MFMVDDDLRRIQEETEWAESFGPVGPVEEWQPADEPPEITEGWVLVVIHFDEPGLRPAIRLGTYDPFEKAWRTEWGRLKDHWRVTHWMRLPEMPEGTGRKG